MLACTWRRGDESQFAKQSSRFTERTSKANILLHFSVMLFFRRAFFISHLEQFLHFQRKQGRLSLRESSSHQVLNLVFSSILPITAEIKQSTSWSDGVGATWQGPQYIRSRSHECWSNAVVVVVGKVCSNLRTHLIILGLQPLPCFEQSLAFQSRHETEFISAIPTQICNMNIPFNDRNARLMSDALLTFAG